MHSSHHGFQLNLVTLALIMTLIVLSFVMHGYQGFAGDAQIYAFQALARIHTALSSDLYLQYRSQDSFTIFSPFYALFIKWLGLDRAARLLTLLFTGVFFVGAWSLAVTISNRRAAWFAVALLIIVSGDYGASGVFRLSEQYLTARLPAEALIIVAIACHLRGMRCLALIIAIAALPIHPLMALPGLLLLACLWLPVRISLVCAITGIVFTFLVTLATAALPTLSHVLTVMDKDWLEIVRERSQFLFPGLWVERDWFINARPLAYLSFMVTAMEDNKIRKLCTSGLLIGLAGLAVALITDFVAPLAVLVQGQPWRWLWIPCLVSILLLPATVLRVWHEKKCGPLCAILLICGWVISALSGTICVLLALIFWVLRAPIRSRTIPYLNRTRIAIGIKALAFAVGSSWAAVTSKRALGADELNARHSTTNATVNEFSAASLFLLFWRWLRRAQNLWVPTSIWVLLIGSSVFIIYASYNDGRSVGSQSNIEEFSDWRAAIPETSTVFVAPARDVGSFVWFTLERPNYLALDQSAGVVFSRKIALEVRRRSELLLPLTEPTWKILSGIRGANDREHKSPTRPLTAQALLQVCDDPQLGFVVSPQNVGFDPMRHAHSGAWRDWYLYDCARVRSRADAKGGS